MKNTILITASVMLFLGLLIFMLSSADIVFGEEATDVAVESVDAAPTKGSSDSTQSTSATDEPQDLETLFLSRLPRELRNQVLEARRSKNPIEALVEAARLLER